MKIRILSIILYVTYFTVIAGLLIGCSSPFVRLPDEKDYKKIKSGEYAIVVLRVISAVDGEPYDAFRNFLPDDNYGLAVGTFRTGGEERAILPFFLSGESRKDGWAYLLLEPGLQYLAVQPPRRTDVWTYASMFQSAPLFGIEIPSKTPLVYIGTLHIPCVWEKIWIDKRLSFVKEKIDVNNEEDKARKIAAPFLSEFGVPKTILMQRHEGPKIFRTPAKRESKN